MRPHARCDRRPLAPLATVPKPGDQLRKAGSAGRPTLNVETRVVGLDVEGAKVASRGSEQFCDVTAYRPRVAFPMLKRVARLRSDARGGAACHHVPSGDDGLPAFAAATTTMTETMHSR